MGEGVSERVAKAKVVARERAVVKGWRVSNGVLGMRRIPLQRPVPKPQTLLSNMSGLCKRILAALEEKERPAEICLWEREKAKLVG